MRTTTTSAFGSPRRAGMRAAALVTLAGAMALACIVLALSAPPARSAEQRQATTPVTGGQTVLTLDRGTATALSDAGIGVKATGRPSGPPAAPPSPSR